jgi:glucose-6-phosphate 1-dehydrogenase
LTSHRKPAAKALADKIGKHGELVVYFALSPSLYGSVCGALQAAGLTGPKTRLVLEKPIGKDFASSCVINGAVGAVVDESQVFRIDHYLGKETVQNLIALRFGNTVFEPLWNAQNIDHVQITVGETVGVGDRWPYYDEYGALRDMLQNHMLQLLCLVAMEPPSDLDPESVRNEKVKVLRSLRPITHEESPNGSRCAASTSAALSMASWSRAIDEERGKDSDTETFVAIRADIDNWRWAGVPFFLRTGKNLPEKRTEIVIQFKPLPHSIFDYEDGRAAGQQDDHRAAARRRHLPDGDEQEGRASDSRMQLQPIKMSLSWGFRDRTRDPAASPHRL